MTSNINPLNIDGNYPVAGVPNNTQGFRDNFGATQTNFGYAADEITELQNTAVLKQGLGNTVPDNNMNSNLIYDVSLSDVGYPEVQLAQTSGSIIIDYSAGMYQTVPAASGSISLGFSNWSTSGVISVLTFTLVVTNTAHTLTLPAAVSLNTRGIQGLNTSTNIITFSAIGTYNFTFTTSDGGTTITINETNKEIQPFNNSSEDLAASAAANLSLTTSYFTTAAAETATLAAGVSGQIKIFAATDISSGNMVITVTNAGWKASGTGTITFDARGDACTLQYINSKWFCIGNNGCVFG